MKIKERLKKDHKVYAIATIARCLKSKELCDKIWGINNDPLQNTIIEKGAKNQGCVVYDLYLDHDSLGFFGLIRWLCGGLIFAERFGYKVSMSVSKNCLYYDAEYSEIDNPLGYYFDLSGLVSKEELDNSQNVLRFAPKHLLLCDLYYEDRSSVEQYAEVWKKYFVLKEEIASQIYSGINRLLGNKKTIGVHYRGTDYKVGYKNHPIAVNIDETIEAVKKVLKSGKYEKIFVATDEQNAIYRFRIEFGDMVATYDDTLRSEDGNAVHTSDNCRRNHKFLLGFEVLRDVMTLSACDALIAGHSNVSAFADVIKTANNERYEYFHIINKGKNKTGKVYKRPQK